jgi:hypothetical protein
MQGQVRRFVSRTSSSLVFAIYLTFNYAPLSKDKVCMSDHAG